jgi:hypothetical protein
VRGGLTLFVPKQEADTPYNSLYARMMAALYGAWAIFRYDRDVVRTQLQEGAANGKLRQFHAMPYRGRNIWGETVDILRKLYERPYS